MSSSVNGWPVLPTNRTTGKLPRLRKWVVPGTGRHLYLRDGSAGFLLVHFACWWHDKVSRLDGGVWDEWGWAVRPIAGKTSGYSNHASGTAMDLDATQYPWRVPILRVMSPLLVARIRFRLRRRGPYKGLLRWGGQWSTPDGMHTEISPGVTLGAVEARARELLKTSRGRAIIRANPGARAVIES